MTIDHHFFDYDVFICVLVQRLLGVEVLFASVNNETDAAIAFAAHHSEGSVSPFNFHMLHSSSILLEETCLDRTLLSRMLLQLCVLHAPSDANSGGSLVGFSPHMPIQFFFPPRSQEGC